MPRFAAIQTNFTGGEWTPTLAGHVDLQKYHTSLSCLYNFLVRPQGGAIRRPGMRRVATAKTSASAVRVVRFEVLATTAYVLEFGALYLRVYRNGAPVLDGTAPVEIVTPYAAADLFGLHFVPSIDALYLFHPDYQPRK